MRSWALCPAACWSVPRRGARTFLPGWPTFPCSACRPAGPRPASPPVSLPACRSPPLPRSICTQLASTTVCDTAFTLLRGSEASLNATCTLMLPALFDDSRCSAPPRPASLLTTSSPVLPARPHCATFSHSWLHQQSARNCPLTALTLSFTSAWFGSLQTTTWGPNDRPQQQHHLPL